MVSGNTLKELDLDKKTSRKSFDCAPSRREVCTKCEGYRIWISKSMIEHIEKTESVRESLAIEMLAPLVTSSSLLAL